MGKPFKKEEKEVMDLLLEAHNKFVKIKQTHPSDMGEWIEGVHRCQRILQGRVVRRDYPYDFYNSSKPKPPNPPLGRVLRQGASYFCKICNSTMTSSGFFRLYGKKYCDNKECSNSKPEKNYYEG